MNEKWIDDDLIFPGVKEYIGRLAEGFNLPPAIVIQNMIIRRIAEEDAASQVYGAGPELLIEFMGQDGELITGQQLYEILFKSEKEKLERQYIDTLLATPWDVCSESEKELLTRHGIGPVAEAKRAEEKQSVEELRKKYGMPEKQKRNAHWEE